MKALTTLEAIEKFNWPKYRSRVCEITLNYQCNAKCFFCYTETINPFKEMKLRDVIIHLHKSYTNNEARICQIIGGEPTLYPYLINVISAAKKIGYKIIQLVTNGIKLHDFKFVKKLKEAGLNSITFSVHSSISTKHDSIVGVGGAFHKIKKAIENAIKLEIYVNIGTAVTSLNYKDIPEIVKYFNNIYSIETFHIIALHMIGRVSMFKKDLKVKYTSTLPYIKKAINHLISKNAFPISQILSNYTPCLLPGYENLISDWKIPFYDDDLILPETSYYNSMYTMITKKLRIKTSKCENCIYYKICAGFEKKYYEEFGDNEFKPLKKIHAPIKLSCFYKR